MNAATIVEQFDCMLENVVVASRGRNHGESFTRARASVQVARMRKLEKKSGAHCYFGDARKAVNIILG